MTGVQTCALPIYKIMEGIDKTEKKKKSTQSDLDNVTTGRKTVKTMFKSQGDAGKMVNAIESVSKLKNFQIGRASCRERV